MTGGEDTASYAIYADYPDLYWELLTANLTHAKLQAQHSETGLAPFAITDTMIAEIHSRGCKMGNAVKGPGFEWRLDFNGIHLNLANRQHPHPTIPNIYLTIGSLPLMQHGIEHCWQLSETILQTLGARNRTNKISRIDMAADIPDLDTATLQDLFATGLYICRARKATLRSQQNDHVQETQHYDGRKKTGFTIGTGPILLRVYDKLTESKHQPAKLAALRQNRWNGQTPTHATRVEYQLRREALRTCRIADHAQYMEKRAQLAAYLTGEWFTMLDHRQNNNRHTDRKVPHAAWQTVTAAFTAWTAPADPLQRTHKAPRPLPLALIRQAQGCLATAAALALTDDDARKLRHYLKGIANLIQPNADTISKKRATLICQGKAPDQTKTPARQFYGVHP